MWGCLTEAEKLVIIENAKRRSEAAAAAMALRSIGKATKK
jgi:hypothetical protein